MGSSEHGFVNVAGVDPRHGAFTVFVWCRSDAPEGRTLLGSGRVVVGRRPPGIQAGQFSVTFPLLPGCKIDDLFVTSDANATEHVSDVTIMPCAAYPVAQIRAAVARGS